MRARSISTRRKAQRKICKNEKREESNVRFLFVLLFLGVYVEAIDLSPYTRTHTHTKVDLFAC